MSMAEQFEREGFQIEGSTLFAYEGREREVRVPEGIQVIGESAFKAAISLEKIVLPDSVICIEANAFKGCRKLKEIRLPVGLLSIGDYAFHRCHMLKEVILPDGVDRLGDCVFLYCDGMERIVMPGVKTLGRQVFLNDIGLRELVVSRELDLGCVCDVFTGCAKIEAIAFSDGTRYSLKPITSAIFEDSCEMFPDVVRAIVGDVFRMMEMEGKSVVRFLTNIKHIELPEGITEIGNGCFFDKRGILSVKLPRSVQVIGSRAFRNCISLERVELEHEHMLLRKDAFKNCTTLKTIVLANKEYELNGIHVLAGEHVPELITSIHAQVLSNFFISGTTLLRYRGNESRVVIPDGITCIAPRAFMGNEAIDRVILPEGLEEIGEEAFMDCLLLQTIPFPKTLRKIGRCAFENCVKLIRVELPEAVEELKESVFNRCRSLVEVVFGANVRKIGDLAFYGCHALRQIIFPECIEGIGDLAFYQCTSLREVALPRNIRTLGRDCFTLSGVKKAVIACDPEECGADVFSQCGRLKKIIFQEGVSHIGNKFAFHCPALLHVEIPSSIKGIGKNAFDGSPFQAALKESERITGQTAGIVGAIFLDGAKCFGEIRIPDGIKAIAGGAFYGNQAITSVILPDTLEEIGARAFCGCTGLESITIPEKVTRLEEGVFAYCDSLKEIFSRGKLLEIGENACYQCHQLFSVPTKDAERIGTRAFGHCEKLEYLEWKENGDRVEFGEDVLDGTRFLEKQKQSGQTVLTINGTVVDGKEAFGCIRIPDGIKAIAPYAFYGNQAITEIIFPETLKQIGECAFLGCSSLEYVTFHALLERIEEHAFEKCRNLRRLSCQTGEIGEEAFSNCRKLEQIELIGTTRIQRGGFSECRALKSCEADSLDTVEERGFYGCESLVQMDVSHLDWIGESAFGHCDSLVSIALKKSARIERNAFVDCGHLREIYWEEKETMGEIECKAFSGCTALEKVWFNSELYWFQQYADLQNPAFPELVKSTFASAMSCFQIDEDATLSQYYNTGRFLKIPDGVKRIEQEVCKEAMNLEQISIPKSVQYIGPRAFHGTKWMEHQREHSTLVIVNSLLIDGATYQGELSIPEHVKLVSGWAFANAFGITELRFHSRKTQIEDHAFRNCIFIRRVVDLDGNSYPLTKLSDLQREMPPFIKQILIDCENCFKVGDDGTLTECTGNISRMVLPEGIQKIGDMVFQEGNLITEITLANTTDQIGVSAFEGCKWLSCVKNAQFVKHIGKRAFFGCVSLQYIETSEKLKEIGMSAFENCTSLKYIEIPEGVTEIPSRAFYRCHELEVLCLPSTLETIGEEAFAFCYKLKHVKFPRGNHIKGVKKRAFAWCKHLEKGMGEGLLDSCSIAADAFAFSCL